MTAADLLVLAPWLIFGAALAVICYRLLAAAALLAGTAAVAGDGYPGPGVGGSWVRHPCLPAVDPLVTRIIRGCARHIHPSSIARTSPLRIGGLSRRQGLIARPLTTMR